MRITEFESGIEQKILARGYDYFESDSILDFEKIGSDTYKGFIRGSNLYNVTIRLNQNAEIIYAYCDCPYNYGIYCKHEVALMYMIRDLKAYDLSYQVTGKIELVNDAVKKMEKYDLVELVKNICISDRRCLNLVLTELEIDDDEFEEYIEYYE